MLSENESWINSSDHHPDRSPSEVTILNLDEGLLEAEDRDVDAILKNKYNEEERKLIIVDRSKGKIIDSRLVDVEETIAKSQCKPLKMTTQTYSSSPQGV
jgi:hypothetical protein